jgi:hypothetical protein
MKNHRVLPVAPVADSGVMQERQIMSLRLSLTSSS